MKVSHFFLSALVVLLLYPLVSLAGHAPDGERHMEIKIAADGEIVTLSGHDLDIGETRQSFTESGKEVLITRTEDGLQLEVDGKEINVDMPRRDHLTTLSMTGDKEGHKVIVHRFDGHEGEHGYEYVHGAGDVVVERFSAADRLIETGVLDDLDEAKRQEILDALQQLEPHRQVRVKIDKEQ